MVRCFFYESILTGGDQMRRVRRGSLKNFKTLRIRRLMLLKRIQKRKQYIQARHRIRFLKEQE